MTSSSHTGLPERLPRPARWLLLLFPAPVRREFGEEILSALERWRHDRTRRGAGLRFWTRATADLAVAGSRMRLRALLGLSGSVSSGRPVLPRQRIEAMFQDLRYAVRALRGSPSFAATALLLLTVGIGANAAIFSLVSTFLLKPYPYAEPDRIVTVNTSSERYGFSYGNVSLPDYLDLRDTDVGLETVALYGYHSYNVASADAAVWIPTAHVTANFFDVLGLEPLLGRTFLPGEDDPGANVIVLSESVWRDELGGDPAVVGSQLTLDGVPHTVVGVIPSGTEYPDSRRMWKAWLGDPESEPRSRRVYRTIGRLAPGESLSTVRPRLAALGKRLQAAYPDSNGSMELVTRTLREARDGDTRPMLVVLMVAVGLLLLLICANLANLMLARSQGRRREVAIRAALGAGRGRIARQMIFESGLLACSGGVLGVVLGQRAVRALLSLRLRPLPSWYTIGLDWRVVAFSFGATLLATVLFGLGPSVRLARGDVQQALRDVSTQSSGSTGERRLLSGLIVVEVAFSVILLVGAGLTARSFRNLATVDPGFAIDNRLSVAVQPPESAYDRPAIVSFVRRLEERLRALPGVRAVGAASLVPLIGTGNTSVITENQTEAEAEDNPYVQFTPVTPGFFDAIGIERLAGRTFTDADAADSPPVAVISEGMARRFWPDGALGERFRIGGQDRWFTVVGVVNDVHYEDLTSEVGPQMYLPHAQEPWRWMGLVIATDVDALSLAPTVRQTIRELDPSIAGYNVATLEQVYDQYSFDERFSATLLSIFATIAAVLACVGVYAMLAFAVARRTREIGIRQALGAAGRDVTGMVVRQGAGVIGAGLGLGLAAAFALSRWISSQLYGVDPHDPVTYLAVVALTAVVAVVATALPARRAARLDPVSALRRD